MSKDNDMDNTVAFEDWYNYRTLVSKITVANRGGGVGFNLYFEFPAQEVTDDKRYFGARLDAAQLESLGSLIGDALEGKSRDDVSMDGGVYSNSKEKAQEGLVGSN